MDFQQLKKLADIDEELEKLDLFPIAFAKANELTKKLEAHACVNDFNIYLLGDLTIGNINHSRVGNTVKLSECHTEDICNFLTKEKRPSIVLLTNNTLAEIGYLRFQALRDSNINCIYLIHDYDCHHWYTSSIECMLLSDIYVPAHHQMPKFTRLLTSHKLVVIPIGSIQWKKEYLLANSRQIYNQKRDIPIAGRHAFYEKFFFRN
jgi:hypothetical protein